MIDREPEDIVIDFVNAAKLHEFPRYDAALWKIAKMSWWERLWHGRSVAEEALQIGRFYPVSRKQ